MIARHEDDFPVRLLCRVLEVSVSGYYAYRRRPETWRAVIDDVLMAHVRIAFAESGETYGATRHLPVHRDVVQPEATALDLGVRQFGGVRSAVTKGRVVPFNYASTFSG